MPSPAALTAARRCLGSARFEGEGAPSGGLRPDGRLAAGATLMPADLVTELVAGTIEGVMRGCAARKAARDLKALAPKALNSRPWQIRAQMARDQVRTEATLALANHGSESIPFRLTDDFSTLARHLADLVLAGAAHPGTTEADIDAARG